MKRFLVALTFLSACGEQPVQQIKGPQTKIMEALYGAGDVQKLAVEVMKSQGIDQLEDGKGTFQTGPLPCASIQEEPMTMYETLTELALTGDKTLYEKAIKKFVDPIQRHPSARSKIYIEDRTEAFRKALNKELKPNPWTWDFSAYKDGGSLSLKRDIKVGIANYCTEYRTFTASRESGVSGPYVVLKNLTLIKIWEFCLGLDVGDSLMKPEDAPALRRFDQDFTADDQVRVGTIAIHKDTREVFSYESKLGGFKRFQSFLCGAGSVSEYGNKSEKDKLYAREIFPLVTEP